MGCFNNMKYCGFDKSCADGDFCEKVATQNVIIEAQRSGHELCLYDAPPYCFSKKIKTTNKAKYHNKLVFIPIQQYQLMVEIANKTGISTMSQIKIALDEYLRRVKLENRLGD